jgi:ketosteroid isomerase-like protein
MKIVITGLLIIAGCWHFVRAQSSVDTEDKDKIISIMKAQEQAWSNQDLEGFMKGYWENDSLKFYGSQGVTYGYRNILENYRKRYPSKAHTGTLRFKINDLSEIEEGSYFVLGEYHLTREVGDANGVFMIIFKKINGEWKIIADMSC